MARHIIEIVGLSLFIFFIITMIYHGHMILYQKNGYSHRNMRIDSENMRKRVEKLLKDK